MIRIIIVEDDPLIAQLNAAYLSRLDGFQVTGVFTNSLEALTSLRENPVELAIVDVYMPVCTGVELLRRVRSEQLPTAVIMVTAATEMPVVEEALRLGIEDYIIKPFSYDRLRDSIQRFRDKKNLVHGSARASQAMVDQLLGNQRRTSSALPKGLNAKTLESIRKFMDDPAVEYTCESLSADCGLSRVTVRHYLNYLIDTGVLSSSVDYETGGRPRQLYRLK